VERPLRGDAHGGCGRRSGETHRWKHRQGAPGRPHLVPTHDRSVSASSKNYRYSVNMQVVIDANTRLGVAVGATMPGNRNDCRAYRESGVDQQCAGAQVMADGGYRGNQ
jgi:DDE family transposase